MIDGARPPVALRGKPRPFVVLVEALQETSRSQPGSPCMSAASASATEGESFSGSRRRQDPLHGRLAEAPAAPEPVRYLIRLVLEDEERHHRVLHEIVTAIGNRVALRDDPDAVPNLSYEPPDRVLGEVTGRFLAAERADAKQPRALRKELRPFRDTSLWVLLIELMEHDTAKHIRLLTFIRDQFARQPRRYLAISRALEPTLEETPEPE